MGIEQTKVFFEKVEKDKDLAKRLSEAKDKKSMLQIARQEGFEFDAGSAKKDMELLFVLVGTISCYWDGWNVC